MSFLSEIYNKNPRMFLRYTLRFAIVSPLDATYVEPDAGWSSLAARRAHNPKVTGSNPVPATKYFSNKNAVNLSIDATTKRCIMRTSLTQSVTEKTFESPDL